MTDEIENNSAKVWGVELDGKILNTPLRTYTEARKQAHRVAQGFDDWFGVRVVKEEAQEDQLVDDVGVKMIEEALREYWGERCEDYEAGCGVCEGWRAFNKVFPRNENQNGDTE
jgi:sulfite reductase beta subunit-like hemoprotein